MSLLEDGQVTIWQRWWPPLAVGGAFGAYLVQPLLVFAPPDRLELIALSAAMGFVGLYAALSPRSHPAGRIGWALVLAGTAWFLLDTLDRAVEDARANDRRCIAIQRDMLSSTPLRTDGPDLFQALGCRPQGEGSVYAPPTNALRK